MSKYGQLTQIKVSSAAIAKLLKSEPVRADLERRANAIHAALPTDQGEKWKVVSRQDHDRAAVLVSTDNIAAKHTAATTSVVLSALSAGR